MTAPTARVWSQNSAWRTRLRRHKLVRNGVLLTPAQFCRQRGISSAHLVRLERQRDVFVVTVDRKRYFPAMFADCSFNQRRLAKLLRRLPIRMPPIATYLFFASRRGSLGDKSPLQTTRRARRFRVALRIADNESDIERLQAALKAGEESGPASHFDGRAFLRRKRATSAVPRCRS
jgi:hypothetical protein